MPLVRVLSLVVAAAVLGAGAAYAIAGLVKPDEPEAVAPVVIDPAADTQRTTAATTPTTTSTTRTTRTTRTTEDDGWETGPPIESGDDSGGQGRGRGRGRGGGSSGSSGSGGGDDSSGRGRGGDD